MGQEQPHPRKLHIANLAAAVASFEPLGVNEKWQGTFITRKGKEAPTYDQFIHIAAGAIEEIHGFIELHERLKKQHQEYLSDQLAASVALENAKVHTNTISYGVETLNLRFNQALDILENICKAPNGETQTHAWNFVSIFRPDALCCREPGKIISLGEFVPPEPTIATHSGSSAIPPQP